MKRDRRDRMLHDYLDGRLTDQERIVFERTCERDEELAGRLASYREVRDALRSPIPGPGPDFFAKARDRFAEEPPARRAWWPGLLSWEAAGLTAAIVLAAALFVPTMTDLPVTPPGHAQAEDRLAPAAVPGLPETKTVTDSVLEATPDVAPRAVGEPVAPAPRRAPKGGGTGTRREKKGARTDLRILGLLGPVVEPGAVRTIETRQEWDELFGARASETLPGGAEYRSGERWVVVGPRGRSVSCGAITLVSAPDFHEIRIPAATGSPDRWGCVLIVPDDDLEIRVTDSTGTNDGR